LGGSVLGGAVASGGLLAAGVAVPPVGAAVIIAGGALAGGSGAKYYWEELVPLDTREAIDADLSDLWHDVNPANWWADES
jgi:hypothetical protein